MKKVRTAVLISGRGSNMQALVKAAMAPDYPASIALVVSNQPEAEGLAYAVDRGIPARAISHVDYPSRAAFESELDLTLHEHKIEIVALAGFMRILTATFISHWTGRILNIHPSLLPAYKGLHTHERAILEGAKQHGCTVHLVTADLDAGPILLQAEVPVFPDDTSETLAARVLEKEHYIYPQALAVLASTIHQS